MYVYLTSIRGKLRNSNRNSIPKTEVSECICVCVLSSWYRPIPIISTLLVFEKRTPKMIYLSLIGDVTYATASHKMSARLFDLIRFVSIRLLPRMYTVFIKFVSRAQKRERESKESKNGAYLWPPKQFISRSQCEQENVAWSGVKYTYKHIVRVCVQYLYKISYYIPFAIDSMMNN